MFVLHTHTGQHHAVGSVVVPQVGMQHLPIDLGYVFCGAETVEANCVLPVSRFMNHLSEKWLWVRPQVQVLQLKLDRHPRHLDFLIC